MKDNLNKTTSGIINGHEWVDLGLSVKWATCNVGADSPSEYGNYYAWGETKTKSEYTAENSVTWWYDIDNIAGDPQYDAATANWGGTWRMPINNEIKELIDKCEWEWITFGEKNGYKVTGPNGNSIFLPAAGWRNGTSLKDAGKNGRYWGATPGGSGLDYAYGLLFANGIYFSSFWYYRRYYGQTVRPVSE